MKQDILYITIHYIVGETFLHTFVNKFVLMLSKTRTRIKHSCSQTRVNEAVSKGNEPLSESNCLFLKLIDEE